MASRKHKLLGLGTVLAVAGAGMTATLAGSSDPVIDLEAAKADTLVAESAVRRDCTRRALDAGTSGVVQRRWTATREGAFTVTMRGRSGNDWDLALFDAKSGERVAGSAGFGATEVAQTIVRDGARVLVQACRRSGSSRSVRINTQFAALRLADLLERQPGKAALVEVPIASRAAFERLEASGVDVTHDVRQGRARVITYGDQDREILRKAGFTFRTLVGDLSAQLRAERRASTRYARAAQSAGGSPLPTGRTDYRTYEDIQNELKSLAEKNKGLVRPIADIGKTFQGRELGAIEIAKDVDRADDGRPTFLLNGMHHAREWPSPEGIMEFAHDLVNNNGKDPRITKLLEQVRVVIMPLTNADGYIVSRAAPNIDPDEENVAGTVYSTATGLVIFGGSLGYKRKNCNPVAITTEVPSVLPCEIAFGVDNNRNYGESWGGPGASSSPNSQSYRGSGPFSEPETQAFQKLFSRLNATMMLTVHNVAALVLRPPGLKADGFAPDEPALKELGDAMAKSAGYTSQYGWQLYDTTGTTDDWSYAASGGFGYTIEMGPPGGVFHGNYKTSVIDQYLGSGRTRGKGLRDAYLLAAEAARNPAYTSRVAGRAPAGRTLRITKEFKTATYPVCQIAGPSGLNIGDDPTACVGNGAVQEIPEKFTFETKVPASGNFEWWINPSTRPFVLKAGKTESYKLQCLDGDTVKQETDLVVARGETATIELPCGGTLPPLSKGTSTDVTVTVGRLVGRAATINRRRRAVLPVTVRGGSLTGVRIQLLARRGSKVLATASRKRLRAATKPHRVGLRLRRGVRLARGGYRVRIVATQAAGSKLSVVRRTTARR